MGFEELIPDNFGEEKLKRISKAYWRAVNAEKGSNKKLDFRNAYQVQQLIEVLEELEDAREISSCESNLGAIIDTFWYYVREAELDEVMTDLLEMKIKREHNQKIADTLNEKYHKSYTVNYISTIYCQRLIPKICAAASWHRRIVDNLWYPEEWKYCTGCGRQLLRDSENFTRKTRASDGFSTRCKRCEKEARTKSATGGLSI